MADYASAYRIVAAVVALILVLVCAVGFIRYPRPLMVVPVTLLVAVPAAAFAVFAVRDDSVSAPTAVTWLAYVPVLAGLAAGMAMLAAMRRARTYSRATLSFLANGTAVVWGGIVLGLSDVVYLFEPAFAVANLVLNAAWIAVWIPSRFRRLDTSVSTVVRAPLGRVYDFFAEPANSSRFQEQVEAVSVDPPGPLKVGSQITVRRRIDPGPLRGGRFGPGSVETTSVVTELTPSQAIATQFVGRADGTVRLEFAEREGATTITSRGHAVMPFRFALFGGLVEFRSRRGQREAENQRNSARLKEILET